MFKINEIQPQDQIESQGHTESQILGPSLSLKFKGQG